MVSRLSPGQSASPERGPITGPAPEGPARIEPSVPDIATAPAAYRSRNPRRAHPYRGAVLLALSCLAAAGAAWLAAAEVLLGIEQGAGWLRERDSTAHRGMAATALVALGLLALVVAWGRDTAPRRPVRLADGRGRMAIDAIEALLRGAIMADPDVREAQVWVENAHRRGLRVDVHLRVVPQARIDDVVDGVDTAAEDLVHRRLGVPMDGLPVVNVTYDELDLRAGRAHGSRG